MPAELIPFGEFAYGAGGEFERECAAALRDELPEGYIIATNVHLARRDGGFYECDAVIAAPGICDILEMKCVRPEITVGEDIIVSSTGFCIDRPLSTVDTKAKVLASRRQQYPFPSARHHTDVRVGSQIVVPSSTRISFKHAPDAATRAVRGLGDTVKKYNDLAREISFFGNGVARKETRNAWLAHRNGAAPTQRNTLRYIGRFAVRRQLSGSANQGVYEYFAVDEPPVQMEVLLREYAFDPALPESELEAYLKEVACETRILMKVRHPFVACVVGHFQTGGSWVQVSDWFEGKRLEELWPVIAGTSSLEKMSIFLKVIQALQFCHEKGVFHRNLAADVVWVAQDLADVRLGGFECALDLSSTSTLTGTTLTRRNSRLMAPEDLQTGRSSNPRLADIFQAGVLLYRLLENGKWPFTDTMDYVTGGAHLRPFSDLSCDDETTQLRDLAVRMIDVTPSHRPDPLSRVEQELGSALAGGGR